MRKSQVNAILYSQTKRRNTVATLVGIIIIISIIALSLLMIYFKRSEKQYITYDENSEVDYKVFLKNNDFFDDNYLDENNRYIASLIDYVKANFKYNLSLNEKEVEFRYNYKIQADIKVMEKNTNEPLYTTSTVLLEPLEKTSTQDTITIEESIDIDYNYYNNLIKKLVNFYNLENTESTLTVSMYVNVIGVCEEFIEESNQGSTISIQIPLTTKTVGIDVKSSIPNENNNIIQCKNIYTNNYVFMIFSIIVALCDLLLIIFTIRYEIETRTAENIYEKELKKILNNYSSYIQVINTEFNFDGYQLLKVTSFTDMLEISERIREPILMKENEEKNNAYFVIPSNTKFLYSYKLNIYDIEKDLEKCQKRKIKLLNKGD